MKYGKILARVAVLSAITAMAAQAQSTTCGPDGSGNLSNGATACFQTHVLSTTVNDILLLTVDNGPTSLGNPMAVNYGPLANYSGATPLAATSTRTVKVVANRAHQVTISSTANFGSAPAGVTKPAADVEWKKTGGSFAALSTTGAAVITGTEGTPDTNTALSFQSRWAFERDVPGPYALTVTLTLAAN